MSSSAAKPEPPSEHDRPDWAAVGMGIMTIATIVAVATAAAAIALVREYASGDTLPIATAAGGFAAVSLGAYYGVILTGLLALFLETPFERKERTKLAAAILGFQIAMVVIFAFIAILWPLAAGVAMPADSAAPAGEAPVECAPLPPPQVC